MNLQADESRCSLNDSIELCNALKFNEFTGTLIMEVKLGLNRALRDAVQTV